MVQKVGTLQLRRLSSAKDLLARAAGRIVRLVNSSIWSVIGAFVLGVALCTVSMLAFSWLSDLFRDAGILLLGTAMSVMVWVMGIVLVSLILWGKYWILFRG